MSMLTCMSGAPEVMCMQMSLAPADIPWTASRCSFAINEHQLTSKKLMSVQTGGLQVGHRCWPVGSLPERASLVFSDRRGRTFDKNN